MTYALIRLPLLLLALLTLVPFLRVGAWYVRIPEFFRMQIAAMAFIALCFTLIWGFRYGAGREFYVWLVLAIGMFIWQASHIIPYSSLVKKEVADATAAHPGRARIAVVNLKFENEHKSEVLQQLDKLEVDLLLLIETDRDWDNTLRPLRDKYPHRVGVVRDEGLGIQLWSRLQLIAHEVQHLVSADRASVHATVRLPDGQHVRLVGVHPLPPGLPDEEDGGRHDSRVRDAELMQIAKRVAAQPDEKWLVAGDFNDVAWSHTTRMFQRISGLHDPRVGRGLFNSYHAGYSCLRFPIDQVFISEGAELVELTRFRPVGSDHFAIVTGFQFPPIRVTKESAETQSWSSKGSETQSPDPATAEDLQEADAMLREGQRDASENPSGP